MSDTDLMVLRLEVLKLAVSEAAFESADDAVASAQVLLNFVLKGAPNE